MTRRERLKKLSSPVMAGSAAAAVCLSGGGVAHGVTGPMTVSNGTSSFTGKGYIYAFVTQARWYKSGPTLFRSGTKSTAVSAVGFFGAAYFRSAGFTVGTARDPFMQAAVTISGPIGPVDRYIAVRFNPGSGNRYGWLHVVSRPGTNTSLQIDTWGYNTTGGSIKTLSDSVSTKTLTLSDSRAQLHWTNKNEDGVSRYVVQARTGEDEWTEVDSDTPGTGHYEVNAEGQGAYRLVVEKIDGTTEEVTF